MASIAKRDFLDNLPITAKVLVAQMAPELLVTGQSTSKAIQKFVTQNVVWDNVAKAMNMEEASKVNLKMRIIDEFLVFTKHVNRILIRHLPNSFQATAKVNSEEIILYMAAHKNDAALKNSFLTMMTSFCAEARFTLGFFKKKCVTSFIENGVLKDPSLAWDRILTNALGKSIDGVPTYFSEPLDPSDIFHSLLKEYISVKGKLTDLLRHLLFIIVCQKNIRALLSILELNQVDANALVTFGTVICRLHNPHMKREIFVPLEAWVMTKMFVNRAPKFDKKKVFEEIETEALKNIPNQLRDKVESSLELIKLAFVDESLFPNWKQSTEVVKTWIYKEEHNKKDSKFSLFARYCSNQDCDEMVKILNRFEEEELKKSEDSNKLKMIKGKYTKIKGLIKAKG